METWTHVYTILFNHTLLVQPLEYIFILGTGLAFVCSATNIMLRAPVMVTCGPYFTTISGDNFSTVTPPEFRILHFSLA